MSGMFEQPKPFSEHWQEGAEFVLEDIRHGNEINTEFGPGTPVLMKINGEWYSAFGEGLTNQVDRLEDGDLPAKVVMVREPTRGGQSVKVLKLASAPTE